MILLSRIVIVLAVVPAVWIIIYWVPFSSIGFPSPSWIPGGVALVVAAGVGWRVWRCLGAAAGGMVSRTLCGAVVIGAIAFCAGFFGPIVLGRPANQVALPGVFIIGALGFLLGGAGGLIWWLVERRRHGK